VDGEKKTEVVQGGISGRCAVGWVASVGLSWGAAGEQLRRVGFPRKDGKGGADPGALGLGCALSVDDKIARDRSRASFAVVGQVEGRAPHRRCRGGDLLGSGAGRGLLRAGMPTQGRSFSIVVGSPEFCQRGERRRRRM
jgi:hypothetical protein